MWQWRLACRARARRKKDRLISFDPTNVKSSQIKFKKTIEKAGLSLVNGSVVDPAGTTNGTTTTPQKPKPAGGKRKGAPVLSTKAKRTKQSAEKGSQDEDPREEEVPDQASE